MVVNYLEIFIILLPAALANMIPPFAAKWLPEFSYPMDFGLSFKDKRIFGDHKTIRGLIFGMLAAELGFLLLRYLVLQYLVGEGTITVTIMKLPLLFGGYIGGVALLGDAIKSFFKRRRGIASGQSWFPFDQLDWVIASLFYMSFYLDFTWGTILFALFLGLVGHLVSKVVGFLIGINKEYI